MTDQEAFDKAVSWLLAQGSRSCRGLMCAYRGEDNRRCAIGVLIPDSQYSRDMEGTRIHHLLTEFQVSALNGVSTYLLVQLQLIHDTVPPTAWRSAFESEAKSFCLTWNFNTGDTVCQETLTLAGTTPQESPETSLR